MTRNILDYMGLLYALWIIGYIVGLILLVFFLEIEAIGDIEALVIFFCILFPPIIIVWFIVWVTISICDLIFEDNDNTKPRT